MKRFRESAFTLIELMITVVVVALLATVALPSYLEHAAKARRAEGRNALLMGAQLQERFYSTFVPPAGQSTRYAQTNAELAALYGVAGVVYSGENPALATGNYIITVDFPAASNCVPQTCFRLNAAPNGRHAPDARCGTLTLDSRGTRTASGNMYGAGTQATLDYCWGR